MSPNEDFRAEGTTSSPVAPTSPSTITPSNSYVLSPGAIAGITIGGVAVLLIAAALIYICGRQSRHSHHPISQHPQDQSTPVTSAVTYTPSLGGDIGAFEHQGYAEKDGYDVVNGRRGINGSLSPHLSQTSSLVASPIVGINKTAEFGSVEMGTVTESYGTRSFVSPVAQVADKSNNRSSHMEMPEILRIKYPDTGPHELGGDGQKLE